MHWYADILVRRIPILEVMQQFLFSKQLKCNQLHVSKCICTLTQIHSIYMYMCMFAHTHSHAQAHTCPPPPSPHPPPSPTHTNITKQVVNHKTCWQQELWTHIPWRFMKNCPNFINWLSSSSPSAASSWQSNTTEHFKQSEQQQQNLIKAIHEIPQLYTFSRT